MTVEVYKGFFKDLAEVLDDLKSSGLWPTTFVSPRSPGREVHWHSEDVHVYVLEGNTSMLDAVTDERHLVGPGDKLVVPARTLHAEGEVPDRVVYVIGVPEPMLSEEFLKPRPPEEL